MNIFSNHSVKRVRAQRSLWALHLSACLLIGLLGNACTKANENESSPPPLTTAPHQTQPSLKAAPEKPANLSQKAEANADRAPQSKSQVAPLVAPEAPAPVAAKKYRVAVLGDSITDARVGGGGYLKVLRAACPESQFDNFGKGGDMVNQMLRRMRRDILPKMPSAGYTTLLVYGGVNDLYSNLTAGRINQKIEADYRTIYAEAQAAGLEVMQMTVSPWGGFKRYFNPERSRNTRMLNAYILGQVQEKHLTRVVDTYPLLSCGEPEVMCPAYETRFHDGLHPGPKGHELLGALVKKELFFDCK